MFYLIDKPAGITSFDVIRQLRKTTQINKMGHIGTLDPFATGVMVIATGKSTKLIPLLEWSKKEYIFEVSLDGKSDSLDTDTLIIPISLDWYRERTEAEIRSFLLSQTSQIPPRYSALKIDGERSYNLARKGKEFEIWAREITVHEAQVIHQDYRKIQIRIVISSGWYIRSFAPLIGSFFWVEGWYISSLRRTRICTAYGDISVDSCSPIWSSMTHYSYDQIFHTIPTLTLDDLTIEDIRDGKDISNKMIGKIPPTSGYTFISSMDWSYVSLFAIEGNGLKIVRNDVWDL
jgi:tRNA pseudouridine55 synthase